MLAVLESADNAAMAPPQSITIAEAFRTIVRVLGEAPDEASHYGYECYLPDVIGWYLRVVHKLPHSYEQRPTVEKLSPAFMDAASDLVRLGILRPGIRRLGTQATEEGGVGFSLTAFGKTWLADPTNAVLPNHPSEMGELLAQHRALYGDGFHERAQEATRCHGAGAWLATCVMAGAAAEAILVAVATTKTGDEAQVLRELKASGGRAKLQRSVTAPLTDSDRRAMEAYLELLKPWRDVSAHGAVANLGAFEAYEALTRLMRLAIFSKDHWAKLTT